MSVVLFAAFLLVVSLIKVGDYARNWRDPSGRRRDSSIPSPISLPHIHKSTIAWQSGGFLAVLIVIALLIALGVDSRRVMSTHTAQPKTVTVREEGVALSDDAKRQLEADLADGSIGMDLATMRVYQKALTDELGNTNEQLKSAPRDKTLVKRKQVLEILITNGGATGVNDRLAAMETSMRMVASGAIYTEKDEATVRRAMANLQSSVASWKTGVFANVGRYLGLNWKEGTGLTFSAPYIWEENWWQANPASQKSNKRRPRVKPTLEPASINNVRR